MSFPFLSKFFTFPYGSVHLYLIGLQMLINISFFVITLFNHHVILRIILWFVSKNDDTNGQFQLMID